MISDEMDYSFNSSDSFNNHKADSTLNSAHDETIFHKNINRLETINPEQITYEKYMKNVFEEEVNNLKNSRKEAFAIKRERSGGELKKVKVWEIEIGDKKLLILTKKEIAYVKEIIKNCSPNDEELANYLLYIPKLCVLEENISAFLYNEFLLLISKIFNRSNNINVIKNSALALVGLCHSGLSKFYMIKQAIYKICSILKCYDSSLEPLIKLCLNILSFSSTKFSKKTIKIVINEELIPCLLTYLSYPEYKIKFYAFQIIGNICASNDQNTQRVIDEGFISELKKFMYDQEEQMRLEAVWIVSNIAVGSQSQIESIIEENIFPTLKLIFEKDVSKIRREAIWAICRLSNNKNPYHAEILIEQGIIEVLFKILDSSNLKNSKWILLALNAIKNLLELESIFFMSEDNMDQNSYSIVKNTLISMGVLDKLETMQYHKNEEVYQKVVDILENYFYEYEEI